MAEKEVKVEDGEQSAAGDKPKVVGLNPMVIVILGVVLIAVAGGVAFFVGKMSSGGGGEEGGAAKAGEHGAAKPSGGGGHGAAPAKSGGGHGEKGKDGESTPGLVVNVKEVFVNVAETKGTRILKLAVTIVVSEKTLKDVMIESEALVKDRIGMVASKMTLDQLEGVNGRDLLKKNLIAQLNLAFQDRMAGSVIDVYLAEYLIQ